MTPTALKCLAAHRGKNFLVASNVRRVEMPVTVGHAGLVERERLRGGCPDPENG
jgi:hypothetical protein